MKLDIFVLCREVPGEGNSRFIFDVGGYSVDYFFNIVYFNLNTTASFVIGVFKVQNYEYFSPVLSVPLYQPRRANQFRQAYLHSNSGRRKMCHIQMNEVELRPLTHQSEFGKDPIARRLGFEMGPPVQH